MNFEFSSTTQEMEWSPIGVTPEDETLSTVPLEGNARSNYWSPTVCSQMGFLRSSTSSFGESCPLLSPPGHRSLTNSIDRSSYSSSLRTWDTASTLASVYDPCLEEPIIEDFETGIARTINPVRLTRGKALSTSSIQTIPEEACRSTQPVTSYLKDYLEEKTRPPQVPPKSSKGQGIYYCTVCQTQINRKWDWERQ